MYQGERNEAKKAAAKETRSRSSSTRRREDSAVPLSAARLFGLMVRNKFGGGYRHSDERKKRTRDEINSIDDVCDNIKTPGSDKGAKKRKRKRDKEGFIIKPVAVDDDDDDSFEATRRSISSSAKKKQKDNSDLDANERAKSSKDPPLSIAKQLNSISANRLPTKQGHFDSNMYSKQGHLSTQRTESLIKAPKTYQAQTPKIRRREYGSNSSRHVSHSRDYRGVAAGTKHQVPDPDPILLDMMFGHVKFKDQEGAE